MAADRGLGHAEDRQVIAALDLLGEEVLVEPDELHRTAGVLENGLEELDVFDGRYMRPGGYDFAAQENALVQMAPDVGDARGMTAILIAVGKKPEEVAHRFQAVLGERLRSSLTHAFEELDGSGASDGHEEDFAPEKGAAAKSSTGGRRRVSQF